jgi:hypothetical protein
MTNNIKDYKYVCKMCRSENVIAHVMISYNINQPIPVGCDDKEPSDIWSMMCLDCNCKEIDMLQNKKVVESRCDCRGLSHRYGCSQHVRPF